MRGLTPSPRVAEAFLALSAGEWAGWQCDFGLNGAVRPIADRFVTQTMIDYDQVPSGFELLTTEAVVSTSSLHRRYLRILPEEGCAVDNVAAEVSSSSLAELSTRLVGDPEAGAFALDDAPEPDVAARGAWYLRTVFAAPVASSSRRVRVSLRFDAEARSLGRAKPFVRVAAERRWADAGALDAELQHGGGGATAGVWRTGLDAAFVAQAVAERCFADAAPPAQPSAGGPLRIELPLAVGVQVLDSTPGDAGCCSLEVSMRQQGTGEPVTTVRRHFGRDGELMATEVTVA